MKERKGRGCEDGGIAAAAKLGVTFDEEARTVLEQHEKTQNEEDFYIFN